MRRNKVGIVGSVYCGSTVLSCVLGAHSKITNVGEIKELSPKDGDYGRPRCTPCRSFKKPCPLWDQPWADDLRVGPRIADEILDHLETPALVDSSKGWWWFNQFLNETDSWVFVYLYKSIEEFVASLKMRGGSRYRNLEITAKIWVRSNKNCLTFIKNAHKQSSFVYTLSYKDMMTNMKLSLKIILDAMDLSFEEQMLRFWEVEQHFMSGNTFVASNFPKLEWAVNHDEEFNVARYKERRQTLFYDDKWKKVLTADEIKRANACTGVKQVQEEIKELLA